MAKPKLGQIVPIWWIGPRFTTKADRVNKQGNYNGKWSLCEQAMWAVRSSPRMYWRSEQRAFPSLSFIIFPPSLKPSHAKKNILARTQTPTRCAHSQSHIQWHTNHNSPPTAILMCSCTIIATVIHRCWILLASHKTSYAWFVQSARSVISFSFSFIFPSWATQSIFLLYESADIQRDFQDDYMPHAMGGLRSKHASLRAMSNLSENIYLNNILDLNCSRCS